MLEKFKTIIKKDIKCIESSVGYISTGRNVYDQVSVSAMQLPPSEKIEKSEAMQSIETHHQYAIRAMRRQIATHQNQSASYVIRIIIYDLLLLD